MLKNKLKTNGFTMIEIVIATLVVALIAAFAIPSYKKARDLAIEQGLIKNLKLIHIAIVLYKELHNGANPPDGDLQSINSNLGLNIVADNSQFSIYNGTGWVRAQPIGGAYAFELRQGVWNPSYSGAPGNPYCDLLVGPCPTLK